jgi:hypothetical protein
LFDTRQIFLGSWVLWLCAIFFSEENHGLKQAGNIWNAAIYGYILELGFKCMSANLCVYTISFKERDRMIIAIHVDDFLVATREVHFQWLVKVME